MLSPHLPESGEHMKLLKSLPITMSAVALLLLASCATLQKAMELSSVKFTFDRVSSVRVAGINLMRAHSVDDLTMFQVARATLALSREELPLDMTVHVKTENPLVNQVAATLVSMDWTLMLDGRKTISGTLNDRITIPAGEAQTIPLKLSLNMFKFFNEKNAVDMLDLALAFAGSKGEIPQGVALKIRPTIETPLGPIRYKSMMIQPRAK
jgi:hypothetical protein